MANLNNNYEYNSNSVIVIYFNKPTMAFPYMEEAGLDTKILFAFFILATTFFGLIMKICIFRFLLTASETVSSINGMIFLQQFHRTINVFYNVWIGIAYLLPFTLEDLFGPEFCAVPASFAGFSILGDVFWSTALAITRFIYITTNDSIRHYMKKKYIIGLVCIFNVLYITVAFYAMLHGDQHNIGMQTCTKKTFAFQKVLYEYNYETFWRPIYTTTDTIRHMSGLFLVLSSLLMMAVQFYCYVRLFKYQMETVQSVSAMLNPTILRKRKQTNAITMMGEFISWVAGGWYIIIATSIIILFKGNSGREFATYFRMTQFGVLPLIEIVTSPPLRQYAYNFFNVSGIHSTISPYLKNIYKFIRKSLKIE